MYLTLSSACCGRLFLQIVPSNRLASKHVPTGSHGYLFHANLSNSRLVKNGRPTDQGLTSNTSLYCLFLNSQLCRRHRNKMADPKDDFP
ncbi:uncharacterized protein LOC144907415 [Branchiostoma floridae x Branchiostoma belcheri]